MYKYLHIFETRDEFTEMYNDDDKYEAPWTSYVDEDGGVNYNQPDPHKIYAAIDTIHWEYDEQTGESIQVGERWTRLETGDFYNFGSTYKVLYWEDIGTGAETDGYAMNGHLDELTNKIIYYIYTMPDEQWSTSYVLEYDINTQTFKIYQPMA